MMKTNVPADIHSEAARRPAVRNRQVGIRLTELEYSALEQIAWRSGQTLADWAHDSLLLNLTGGPRAEMEMHIFTELVGIQMLLMSALDPLLRGEKMTQEQVNLLFRQIQTTKAGKAQELLARRSQRQER